MHEVTYVNWLLGVTLAQEGTQSGTKQAAGHQVPVAGCLVGSTCTSHIELGHQTAMQDSMLRAVKIGPQAVIWAVGLLVGCRSNSPLWRHGDHNLRQVAVFKTSVTHLLSLKGQQPQDSRSKLLWLHFHHHGQRISRWSP